MIDVRLQLDTDQVLDLVHALGLREVKAGPTGLIRALVQAALSDPECLSTEHRMIIDAKLGVIRPAKARTANPNSERPSA